MAKEFANDDSSKFGEDSFFDDLSGKEATNEEELGQFDEENPEGISEDDADNEESDEEVLKRLADALGFEVVKKECKCKNKDKHCDREGGCHHKCKEHFEEDCGNGFFNIGDNAAPHSIFGATPFFGANGLSEESVKKLSRTNAKPACWFGGRCDYDPDKCLYIKLTNCNAMLGHRIPIELCKEWRRAQKNYNDFRKAEKCYNRHCSFGEENSLHFTPACIDEEVATERDRYTGNPNPEYMESVRRLGNTDSGCCEMTTKEQLIACGVAGAIGAAILLGIRKLLK